MANVDIKLGYKDSAWFTANATLVLKVGQIVYLEQTGTYKLGDGVTALSALSFLGSNTLGYTPENVSNKSTNVITDQASNTKYPSVKAVYDWATGLFVKKGTLTNNYIPKATASDTIGDSQIFDNGTNVGVGTNSPIVKLHVEGDTFTLGGTRSGSVAFGTYSFWGNATNEITTYKSATGFDLKLQELGGGDVLLPNTSSKLNIANLTPSQRVETDANKNLISVPKGTADNKNFGTTAGTVLEGDKYSLLVPITQSFMPIYSNFTVGSNLTGTVAITALRTGVLIAGGTIQVGDQVEIKARALRDTTTGSASHYLYCNTSDSLSGATLIATQTAASGYYAISRNLLVRSATETETSLPSLSASTDELAVSAATSVGLLNIDWTNDVYIIPAFANAAVGNNTNSRSMLINRTRM